ncbi:TetR/AcrR family transcriptional regulator [Rubellimicrobium rubrum]|uniref:TetR/AcrR family transcriptional regulator n=1 Tax=Rubellimicrobium rubrum TaxID=2585369 RepID=A0A5C4MZ49_9RHOB|nr:TetR/AcrR family transcriptional regulator [Rubellimicrobium rubrum]TNC50415.1 TetR/AcrR family transcriptional regulator [Rubellimicrobium rubrum]
MTSPSELTRDASNELALEGPDVGDGGQPRRRHAAGEDPAKRDQILAGARQVFLERGYDAASINDICRAAGVSKGTIYVYFVGKEDLFVALIEQQRDELFAEGDVLLESDLRLEDKLRTYARRLASAICSDEVIRAQRIIIGTAERMPDLGARFYDSGARRVQDGITRLLEREVAAGHLSIADASLAASQFMELASAGLWRQRLFAKLKHPPTPEVTDAKADAAVSMFMAAYAVKER